MSRRHLIIYAKRPQPGHAKTRLGAAIGSRQAAGVYARLLYTLLTNVIAAGLPETTIELSVADSEDRPFFEAAFPECRVRPQIQGDLGDRMAHSFNQAFDEGATQIVLTGSDVPGLSIDIIRAAFTTLRPTRRRGAPSPGAPTPGVVGPTTDGGYYLIGMQAPGADLFHDVTWSTASVLAETEALARQKNVSLSRLQMLSDIDELSEYRTWRDDLIERTRSTRAGLIPVQWNEG